MTIGVTHLLVVSALLFGIGLFGVFARSDAVAMLMSAQLMLGAAGIALAGFARFGYNGAQPVSGMAFALLVVIAALAQTAVAVGIVLLTFRRHGTVQAGELTELGETAGPGA